jgi:hypothetical protein
MPYFRVLLHGTGILVPPADGAGAPIEGFYTTRAVTAADADAAIRLASALIRAEWTTGSYAPANRGAVPTLSPDQVFEVSFFSRWFNRLGGYTFYEGGDEEEADDSPGNAPSKSLERTRAR